MTGAQIMSEIITIMTSGISSFAQALGSGISAIVKAVFLETTGTGADATTSISTFGVLVIVFAGIALVIGLTRLLVSWLGSMGGSRV